MSCVGTNAEQGGLAPHCSFASPSRRGNIEQCLAAGGQISQASSALAAADTSSVAACCWCLYSAAENVARKENSQTVER